MNRELCKKARRAAITLIAILCASGAEAQQNSPDPTPSSVAGASPQIEQRLDQLMTALDSMHQQLDESQREMEQLRSEIRDLQAQLAQKNSSGNATQAASDLQTSVRELQDQNEVLQNEIKQHEQTKIESLSKYPVRLSGMLLFTSFWNNSGVDNIDMPILATGGPGNLSATARQTILGLEATGPSLWGARSSANISVDFFGGLPYADYTTSAGVLRLRTMDANLDWSHRSLAIAFDKPLISPLQPTSFVTVGEPALAWSGNLWTWTPQFEFKDNSLFRNGRLGLEAALMDVPAPGPPPNTALRQPSPSEQSQQPGYETRLSYAIPFGDRSVEIGAGGYYSRQSYEYDHHLDAWAGTVDWRIPFSHVFALSGEFYRGRSIGGLGGGTFKDYVTYSNYTSLAGLNAEGGWGQLKIKLSRSLEANLAIGQDNAFAADLRSSDFAQLQNEYATLARNRTAFGNLIFRPKTYLLFSAEYRNIYSWPIAGPVNSNHSVGLAAGYLF